MVRGHRADPVQYIVTTLVLAWMRFLAKSHSQQVADKLQRLHFQLSRRAPLERSGTGGTVMPRVVEADNTCMGAAAQLWEVIRSLGWEWPQLRSIQTGTRLYCLPLSPFDLRAFQHDLRQAVRERELRDTQSTHRRGGLPVRRDLGGVQHQLQWEANVRLLRQSSLQEAGILACILSGGIMTRERASKHAKRPDLPPKCIMPGCTCEVETTEHRLWHCPAHEHLRSEDFKQLRSRIDELEQCEINCGLSTNTFPADFSIAMVQRTMLSVEMHARAQLDVLRHGYSGKP